MIFRPKEECVILVVEADPVLRRTVLEALCSWGIDARHAEDLATAVPASLTGGPFHAIICGQTLPDGSGTLLLRWLRDQVITVPFLLTSGGVPPDLKSSSRFGFIQKPFSLAELRTALDRLLPGILPGTNGKNGGSADLDEPEQFDGNAERYAAGLR